MHCFTSFLKRGNAFLKIGNAYGIKLLHVGEEKKTLEEDIDVLVSLIYFFLIKLKS